TARVSVRRMLHAQSSPQAGTDQENLMSTDNIKEIVKEKYGQAALRAKAGGSSCCGSAPSSRGECDPITSNLYDSEQAGEIPETALRASLGCGNPTALAQLNA